MAIYNPKSLKAEEFINHEEILDTIRYAEENKHNLALIDEILAKARPVKSTDGIQTHCAGLSHREASVLLACDIPEKVAEMYELAEEIKQAFYGNRIVMFAPLYLSNYCVNGCVYCPYHMKNKHIARISLPRKRSDARSLPCRIWVTSAWPLKPGRTRSITRSSTFWNPSKQSIPSIIKTVTSAA